jgi:small-conductance mechanosensitive channel
MGRPRKTRKQAVSLFPFLDILACVIGNLILIIATVVLEQVDTQPVAEAARLDTLAEEAERAEAKAAELQTQLDELQKRSGVARETLEQAQAKVAAAKKRIKDAEARASKASQPAQPVPDVTAELRKLEEQWKVLEARTKELQKQLAEAKKPQAPAIAVLPPGEATGPRKGIFVETTKDGLVVHEKETPWKVPRAKIASDPKFQELLKRLKGDQAAIMTFLVRSDGLASLSVAQQAATAAGVRFGRVPLPGDGVLDLSGAR